MIDLETVKDSYQKTKPDYVAFILFDHSLAAPITKFKTKCTWWMF